MELGNVFVELLEDALSQWIYSASACAADGMRGSVDWQALEPLDLFSQLVDDIVATSNRSFDSLDSRLLSWLRWSTAHSPVDDSEEVEKITQPVGSVGEIVTLMSVAGVVLVEILDAL